MKNKPFKNRTCYLYVFVSTFTGRANIALSAHTVLLVHRWTDRLACDIELTLDRRWTDRLSSLGQRWAAGLNYVGPTADVAGGPTV